MNNIQDNPQRVASPESPTEPNYKEIAFDLVDAYLDGDWEEGSVCDLFAEALEDKFITDGKVYLFLRMSFTPRLADLNIEMIDFVNDFALQYVKDRV
tara:strand:- start:35 stop:325 length:291 start_codon:yes stop_codon:yes gene_type:complete